MFSEVWDYRQTVSRSLLPKPAVRGTLWTGKHLTNIVAMAKLNKSLVTGHAAKKTGRADTWHFLLCSFHTICFLQLFSRAQEMFQLQLSPQELHFFFFLLFFFGSTTTVRAIVTFFFDSEWITYVFIINNSYKHYYHLCCWFPFY